MSLETASFIPDLVSSNPAHSDGLNNADAHLRLIKSVLQNTFAGLPDAALTRSPGGIILPTDGTSTAPAYSFASEGTLGFYRSAAGIVSLAGGVFRARGAVPVGSIHMFPVAPANLGNAANPAAGCDFLELDGTIWSNSTYPDLAAFLGQGSTAFALPNWTTKGLFPRSRRSGVAAGTYESNTTGPHTHPDFNGTTGLENQGHTHTFSGVTGSMNQNASHSHTLNNPSPVYGGAGGGGIGGGGAYGITETMSVNAANTDHQHAFSGTTGAEQQAHNHAFTSSTPANIGTTETRPEAMSVIFAIKT